MVKIILDLIIIDTTYIIYTHLPIPKIILYSVLSLSIYLLILGGFIPLVAFIYFFQNTYHIIL